jgi:hypothetical protein
VFTRSGGVWTQQGGKLVGSGASGNAEQGISVALSADGNTAIVGGHIDNGSAGATWVFTRSGGVWTQQENKLVGSDASGNARQGHSVALSCTTAIVGGYLDNSSAGAAWVFVAPTPATATHDFSCDGLSDILWRDTGGGVALWMMNGGSIIASLDVDRMLTNWMIAGTGDFNGDGMADILWRDNTSGDVAMWLMNGGTILSSLGVGNVPTDWQIAQTGDYNGDSKSDILWRNTNGGVAMWLMNGATIISSLGVGNVPTDWQIQGLNAD